MYACAHVCISVPLADGAPPVVQVLSTVQISGGRLQSIGGGVVMNCEQECVGSLLC